MGKMALPGKQVYDVTEEHGNMVESAAAWRGVWRVESWAKLMLRQVIESCGSLGLLAQKEKVTELGHRWLTTANNQVTNSQNVWLITAPHYHASSPQLGEISFSFRKWLMGIHRIPQLKSSDGGHINLTKVKWPKVIYSPLATIHVSQAYPAQPF